MVHILYYAGSGDLGCCGQSQIINIDTEITQLSLHQHKYWWHICSQLHGKSPFAFGRFYVRSFVGKSGNHKMNITWRIVDQITEERFGNCGTDSQCIYVRNSATS